MTSVRHASHLESAICGTGMPGVCPSQGQTDGYYGSFGATARVWRPHDGSVKLERVACLASPSAPERASAHIVLNASEGFGPWPGHRGTAPEIVRCRGPIPRHSRA